ncbi:MAG: hypothetical protein CL760_01715 [Chloroflexi bacterium]|nr:hypothetical protein [Chloroflexota bacterium]|tara:strand:+ start:35162 stop:35512 length:351 start_codon:yes stop_codon:yes gene_type:complete
MNKEFNTFIINSIKEKRKNATFLPVSKKALLHEKQRIRALEVKNPISEIVESMREYPLFERIKNNELLKNVLEKSDKDHYILGKITLSDKIEYYNLMDFILKTIKDKRIEDKKKNK